MKQPGTDARFRRLYDEHFADIRVYCIRRLPVSEVNDAVAEVFAITWRRMDDVPPDADARLWLFGVARNVVRNADRSLRRNRRLIGRIASLPAAPVTGPETVVVRRSQDEAVLGALAQLREADREVLRLSVWEDLSHEEIATVLDIKQHAVTMRLSRARSRLARQLRKAPAHEGPRSAAPLLAREGGASD